MTKAALLFKLAQVGEKLRDDERDSHYQSVCDLAKMLIKKESKEVWSKTIFPLDDGSLLVVRFDMEGKPIEFEAYNKF